MKSKYIAQKILMIRPVGFGYNEETAVNNYYQQKDSKSSLEIQVAALGEFDEMVKKLRKEGMDVCVLEDTKDPYTPDSIFPNNWFTTHREENTVVLYPMFAHNRRLERREDVYECMESHSLNIIDYTHAEEEEIFLEGTGSLVLDRKHKKAYCALSPRANEELLDIFCQDLGYQKIAFHSYQSVEGQRKLIYHTNVMMAMGEKFVILCVDSIDDEKERKKVIDSLKEDGKEIIYIREEQVEKFLGNALEVQNDKGKHYCVLSFTAFHALDEEQKEVIEKYAQLLPVNVSTIEKYGGGSARCMMAEMYL